MLQINTPMAMEWTQERAILINMVSKRDSKGTRLTLKMNQQSQQNQTTHKLKVQRSSESPKSSSS